MTERQRIVLRRLDEIGGWVSADEVAYQLDPDAPYEAFEAAEQGLVETRTYFSLTEKGKAKLEEGAAA